MNLIKKLVEMIKEKLETPEFDLNLPQRKALERGAQIPLLDKKGRKFWVKAKDRKNVENTLVVSKKRSK
jgi:hypothetical protein